MSAARKAAQPGSAGCSASRTDEGVHQDVQLETHWLHLRLEIWKIKSGKIKKGKIKTKLTNYESYKKKVSTLF